MKIIFFGTSGFAIPILNALVKHYSNQVVAVVTKQDSPVHIRVASAQWPMVILTPEKLREIIPRLQELKPDLIVLASYGKIIPQSILDLPRLGCINVHPSLLPRHRGASPLQNTILQGDTETGVTIMKMDAEVDHGPILARSNLETSRFDLRKTTLPELTTELSQLGAKLLIETLPDYINGKIVPQEQDHSKATVTKMFTREDGHINGQQPAHHIERMVRALNPWPGTYGKWQMANGKSGTLKILKARILHATIGCASDPRPGILWLTDHHELAVNANPGSLVLEEVQPESKKPMSGKAFLNGHKKILGTILAT